MLNPEEERRFRLLIGRHEESLFGDVPLSADEDAELDALLRQACPPPWAPVAGPGPRPAEWGWAVRVSKWANRSDRPLTRFRMARIEWWNVVMARVHRHRVLLDAVASLLAG